VKLTFLGTRGYAKPKNERHARHSATLLEHDGFRALLDFGEDWLGEIGRFAPQAVFITHCHPDHAWGLKDGADCPVFASKESWEALASFPLDDQRLVEPGRQVDFLGLRFEYFPVVHSTRCPAGGYRITAGVLAVFYVPDVVAIQDRNAALSGCAAYIGDGASITRSMVRKPGAELVGHAPIRAQLGWRHKEGVPLAIFTHCGSEIIRKGDEASLAEIAALADERGVRAMLAHDGLELALG